MCSGMLGWVLTRPHSGERHGGWHAQMLALQLLLERMAESVELVYDKTSGEVRSFWSLCTREVLAVVLKDLYHNPEHGTPWYDEWVGQFLPEESSTNAAPSDSHLHPIVDPAHGMEDLYMAAAADMVDSDGSASTVDWDTLGAARDLLYHVRLMELLCACTAGQVSAGGWRRRPAIPTVFLPLHRLAEPRHGSQVPGYPVVRKARQLHASDIHAATAPGRCHGVPGGGVA